MPSHLKAMRIMLAILCVVLTGCSAYVGGPSDQDAYFDGDATPNFTNDGFYDGGVFDQDMIDRKPGQAM